MENNQKLRWATAWVVIGARNSLGMTQDQLAGLAGLATIRVRRVEQATRDATIDDLLRIATVLKLNLTELARRIEEELSSGPRKPQIPPGRPRKLTKSRDGAELSKANLTLPHIVLRSLLPVSLVAEEFCLK